MKNKDYNNILRKKSKKKFCEFDLKQEFKKIDKQNTSQFSVIWINVC